MHYSLEGLFLLLVGFSRGRNLDDAFGDITSGGRCNLGLNLIINILSKQIASVKPPLRKGQPPNKGQVASTLTSKKRTTSQLRRQGLGLGLGVHFSF